MTALSSTFNWLLNLFYPNRCLGCRKEGVPLCAKCLAGAKRESLGNLASDTAALFSYQDPTIKQALRLLKYGNRKGLAEIFGRELAEYLKEELSEQTLFADPAKFLVTAVPLSSKRRRTRGYNQSAFVASELAKNLNLPFAETLIKTRETRPQMSLKRADRLTNLTGAFAVARPELVAGKVIFLVDDIVTTGSTLRECADVLKKAGAQKVLNLAVAH